MTECERIGEATLVRTTTAAMLRALGGETRKGRLLACLRLRPGAFITKRDLIEYVWGDDEAGGPEAPGDVVSLYICELRKRGWRIEVEFGHGVRVRAERTAAA